MSPDLRVPIGPPWLRKGTGKSCAPKGHTRTEQIFLRTWKGATLGTKLGLYEMHLGNQIATGVGPHKDGRIWKWLTRVVLRDMVGV